jgi:hypothetical protein
MTDFKQNQDLSMLEVVYYPSPIPSSWATLTFLGLIFDKIHFPNVYLPSDGFDKDDILKEADRIESLGIKDYNTALLIRAFRLLPFVSELKKFCFFTGNESHVFGGVDDKAIKIVKALEVEIFGPPKKNLTPNYESGFNKMLPDGKRDIDYPGRLHYPANAMIYAAHHGIPLINDNVFLPIPAIGGDLAKNNTKLLSTILAMECANLVLPKIKVLRSEEILEMREDLAKYISPFRLNLLRFAAELNNSISQMSNHKEIMQAAHFVVETSIYPSLVELREAIKHSKKRWLSRAFDVAKQVAELAASFFSMPPNYTIAKVLAAIGSILVDVHSENAKNEGVRSGMYYLLKLHEANE